MPGCPQKAWIIGGGAIDRAGYMRIVRHLPRHKRHFVLTLADQLESGKGLLRG